MYIEKIIGGKRYSTENAFKLWDTIKYHTGYDIDVDVYQLYITKKGNYFLVYGENINMTILQDVKYFDLENLSESKYNEMMDLFDCPRLDIKPLTEDEAKSIVSQYGTYEEYDKIFDSDIEDA